MKKKIGFMSIGNCEDFLLLKTGRIVLLVLILEYPIVQKMSITGARKSSECEKVLKFVTCFWKLKKI